MILFSNYTIHNFIDETLDHESTHSKSLTDPIIDELETEIPFIEDVNGEWDIYLEINLFGAMDLVEDERELNTW